MQQQRGFTFFWKKTGLVMVLVAFVMGGLLAYGADADDVLRVRARQGQDIDTMDPAHYLGNEEYNIDIVLYSKLVQYEPGSAELRLDAAESLEVSEDGRVIEFTLREGIQFHHGYGEMTAEDVKFSFERLIDPEVNSAYASDWATLEQVEVTGRYSGRIILSEPFAPLFSSTLPWTPGSIISRAAYEERGELFATQPVGSGPYYWAEWRPNQLIVLERFEDYYGEAPGFRRVEIHPVVDPQIAEFSFDARELDSTEISLESIERYQNDPNVVVEVLSTLRYHWVGFNHQSEPFDDPRVREALRYAVDVDEILIGAYNNVPRRANTLLAPDILGYWEDAPAYEPDLERARALLAEAGYPDGFATRLTTDNNPLHMQGAAIVQQQLQRIGIETSIDIVPTLYASIGEDFRPGLHYASFSAILDPGYWFEWFTCEQIGQWNYWKWCNEEFDALKEQGALTVEPEERAEIYVRMQQIIDEDVATIWVTNGANVHVYREGELEPVFLAMYSQYHYWRNPRD
jgi:peptide/nickel transport system substrate-binding protein